MLIKSFTNSYYKDDNRASSYYLKIEMNKELHSV